MSVSSFVVERQVGFYFPHLAADRELTHSLVEGILWRLNHMAPEDLSRAYETELGENGYLLSQAARGGTRGPFRQSS